VIDQRLIICAVLSVGGHLVFGKLLEQLPARDRHVVKPPLQVRVIEPPPPPEPVKPPEPPPPPPTPTPTPTPVVAKQVKHPSSPLTPPPPTPPPPVDTPPTNAPTGPATTNQPVFGVSMESTTGGGNGPAMNVGNSTNATAPKSGTPQTSGAGGGHDAAAPVAAYEVTKMPLPRGRCAGTYTEEAKEAAIEGVVVLDLTVDATGHTRDIKVVEGLEHGLTEAALAALRACTFDPGERDGVAVPVRVRGFKIRFVLDR
jgi:protein TonB